MKLTIIGGSGGTGAALGELALAAGHDVTVLSRSGKGPEGSHIVKGDATEAGPVREAVAGADAVVVTVGGSSGGGNRHRAEVTRSVIAAMKADGPRRLLVQSSLGAGDSGVQLSFPFRQLSKVVLAKPLADHNEQEKAALSSGLDVTVVRPTGLTNDEPVGTWTTGIVGDGTKFGPRIPRKDLAAFMLEALEDDSLIGTAVGIATK